MTDEALRQKILSALANGPLSFVSLHAKIGGDSRHLMHMLQVLGNQKLVTFNRTDGWALTDEADVEPSSEREAPTVTRIEAAPPADEAPRPRHNGGSVSMRTLEWLRENPGERGVGEIANAISSYSAAVSVALEPLVRKKLVLKSGQAPRTRYAAILVTKPEVPPLVDEIVAKPETVADPVSQPEKAPEAEQQTTVRSQRWISLRIPVPIDKAVAVILAIEQALA